MITISVDSFRAALESSWSRESSSIWKVDNPALGQCGVTALVAQNILGGDILKTKYGKNWHFYNRIGDKTIDFTQSQFDKPMQYSDFASDRKEAFEDTNEQQYTYLYSAVNNALSAKPGDKFVGENE